jgi:uncharacterized protein (TIGR02646 family)
VDHGPAWTLRWLEIHAGDREMDWAPKSAKRLLSEELQKLTFGKCAFCESLLGVSTYAEADHYVAKTVRPAQTFEWRNLFPACRWCNRAKADIDHAGMLLKPDVDDPENMLWLHPDTGELQPKLKIKPEARRRVERTLDLCQLQRGSLCKKRIDKMEFTIRWLERFSGLHGGHDSALMDEWFYLIDPHTEYKFVIRHVFETRGAPQLAAKDRACFQ